jgi:hypothetical protein
MQGGMSYGARIAAALALAATSGAGNLTPPIASAGPERIEAQAPTKAPPAQREVSREAATVRIRDAMGGWRRPKPTYRIKRRAPRQGKLRRNMNHVSKRTRRRHRRAAKRA